MTLRNNFEQAVDSPTLSPKAAINRHAPVSSLVAAGGQFTAIADTDHASPAVMDYLAREIDNFAKAGVKNLLLEITLTPPPGHPSRNAETDRIEDMMARISAQPPQISGIEIFNHRHLFITNHDKSPDGETGTAYALLIAKALSAGIRVHFAGDHKGHAEDEMIQKLETERENYIKRNPVIAAHSDKFLQDENYLSSLRLSAKGQNNLFEKIKKYWDDTNKIAAQISKIYEQKEEERLGYASEQVRAKRFADLAQGEKSLVVFGSAHFYKGHDLNEAIDEELKQRALKNGTKIPLKTEVVEIHHSREHTAELEALIGPDNLKIQSPSMRIYANNREIEIPAESADRLSVFTPQRKPLFEMAPP